MLKPGREAARPSGFVLRTPCAAAGYREQLAEIRVFIWERVPRMQYIYQPDGEQDSLIRRANGNKAEAVIHWRTHAIDEADLHLGGTDGPDRVCPRDGGKTGRGEAGIIPKSLRESNCVGSHGRMAHRETFPGEYAPGRSIVEDGPADDAQIFRSPRRII